MQVNKAVIPAAGHGTRMRPVTRVVPKELLPVGSKPAIQYGVEEAMAAGINEIAVVVAPGKDLIRTYLDLWAVEEGLDLRFEYVTQDVQRGLADAVSLCREFAAGEPFALLLPDNVLLSPEYELRRMVELYEEFGRDVLGVLELTSEYSNRFGNCGRIEFEPVREGVLEISKLQDKQPGRLEIADGETVVRSCGRYICHSDLFEQMDRVRPTIQGEFDEVPVYQEILRQRGAVGCVLPLPLFDVGNPGGYTAANAYLASGERR